MLKKIFSALSIVALVAVAAINLNISSVESVNAQALAGVAADKIPCFSSAKEIDKKSYTNCSDCSLKDGWEGTGTEAKCTKK